MNKLVFFLPRAKYSANDWPGLNKHLRGKFMESWCLLVGDTLSKSGMTFELDKPRRETIVLRVQESIKKNMERFARSRGLNLSTLARMWIMEKLEENLRAGKKVAAGK